MKDIRSKTVRVARVMLTVALAAASASCGVESSFTLSRDSRMPRWFSESSSRLPDDAVVELVQLTGGTDVMTLYKPGSLNRWTGSASGRKRAEVRGVARWHPVTRAKQNRFGGFDEGSYPHYLVMWVDQSFEILEFRTMGSVFYISDDPQLRSAVEEPGAKR